MSRKILWDCGCKTWKEDDIFYIEPCSLDCKVYKIAVEESRKRGNRIEVHSIDDKDAIERARLIASRPDLGPPQYRWRKKSNSIRE